MYNLFTSAYKNDFITSFISGNIFLRFTFVAAVLHSLSTFEGVYIPEILKSEDRE